MGVGRRVTKHRKPGSSKPVIFQVRRRNPEVRLHWGLPMLRRGRDGIRAQVSDSHFRGRAAEHGPQAQGQLEGGHLICASPGKGLFVIGRFTLMGFLVGVRVKPLGTCPGNNRSP